MTNLRLEPTFEPIHLPHATTTYGSHPSKIYLIFKLVSTKTCIASHVKAKLQQKFWANKIQVYKPLNFF
jgi:hypothetical protein